MANTPGNVVIGACSVSETTYGALGLTTEAGVSFSEATRDYYDVYSDQVLMPVKKSLIRISRTISFELQEVTMANMKLAFGANAFASGVALKYVETPEELVITITGPTSASKTFTYVTTCWSISCGDVVRHKSGEAVLPVTLEEKGDVNYNTFGIWTEA